MSIKAVSWALDTRLKHAGLKLLLVILGDYCNEEGICWPSTRRLSERTGTTPRTVKKYLTKLEYLGLLSKETRQRPNGSYQSSLYKLPFRQGDGVLQDTTTVSQRTPLEPSLEPLARHPEKPRRRGKTRPIWGKMLLTGEEGLFLPLGTRHRQPGAEPLASDLG